MLLLEDGARCPGDAFAPRSAVFCLKTLCPFWYIFECSLRLIQNDAKSQKKNCFGTTVVPKDTINMPVRHERACEPETMQPSSSSSCRRLRQQHQLSLIQTTILTGGSACGRCALDTQQYISCSNNGNTRNFPTLRTVHAQFAPNQKRRVIVHTVAEEWQR